RRRGSARVTFGHVERLDGGLPFGGGLADLLGDRAELEVEAVETAFVGVGGGVLERGGDLALPGLEVGDLLFELADFFAHLAKLVGGELGAAGGRCGRGGGGFFAGAFVRVGSSVGEAGGQRGAGV